MATPPSPSFSKPISTVSTAAAASSFKKPQPIPWTDNETVHLVQAYQEKWYSLKRGPLKSSQWEQVSVTVAGRCGYDYSDPSKTAIQCRHKMEKLRQRYRSEKQRLLLGGACNWQYFDLMDHLERGPLPISARPIASIPHENREVHQLADKLGEDYTDEDEDEDENYSKSRSINHILRKPIIVNRFSGEWNLDRKLKRSNGVSRFGQKKNVVEEGDDQEKDGEDEEEEVDELDMEVGERGGEMVVEMAGEIRAFAERIVGMESKKMEMMRETERWRMEMENRRIQMIFESQQKIVSSISMAFSSPKR